MRLQCCRFLGFLSLLVFVTIFAAGCPWDSYCTIGNNAPNPGFQVTSELNLEDQPEPAPPVFDATGAVPLSMSVPTYAVWGTYDCDFLDESCFSNASLTPLQWCTIADYGYCPSVGSTTPFSGVTNTSGYYNVSNGRVNAVWTVSIDNFCDTTAPLTQNFGVPTDSWGNAMQIGWLCVVPSGAIAPASPGYFSGSSLPSSITVAGSNLQLTSVSGMPRLYAQTANPSPAQMDDFGDCGDCDPTDPTSDCYEPPVGEVVASSISASGTSATFPYPTLTNGSRLPAGFYMYTIYNQPSAGNYVVAGIGFFSVGSSQVQTSPFAVDTGTMSYNSTVCDYGQYYPPNGTCTNGPSGGGTVLAFTSLTKNTLNYNGGTFTVGSEPVAMKLFNAGTVSQQSSQQYSNYVVITTQLTTGPKQAIVVNYGSNNVSIVPLAGGSNQTITVGTQPVSVVLNSAQTKAYIANYGSGTVSEINLANNTVDETIPVGPWPMALTMDPSGTALWVGGLNYIEEINLSTYGQVASLPASGYVTSLAISPGQNAVVYTTVSSDLSTFQAQHADIVKGTVLHAYAKAAISGTPYSEQVTTIQSGSGSNAGPPGYLVSTSALVSAQYGNSLAVVGTPSGYSVIDLIRQIDLIDAATPTPVAGIAIDSAGQNGYLTIPNSNTLITLPLPTQHAYASDTLTVAGSEQTISYNPCASSNQSCPQTSPDSGTISITAGGLGASVSYGAGDTPQAVAARLTAAIQKQGGAVAQSSVGTMLPLALVTASNSGNGIILQAQILGPGPNRWPVKTTCTSNFARYGANCSFPLTASSSTLSGGR